VTQDADIGLILYLSHAPSFSSPIPLAFPPARGRFVTEDMLLKCMPKASAESVVLMCGPPVMIDRAVKPNLEKLGFDKAQMLAF
jgi:NAD(P)H-flavin reductase